MRYFKLVTHLTVPRSLMPGLGNTHVRPVPGDTLALDDVACATESRFVNGRVRAGDMIEIKEAEHTVKTCAYQKHVDGHAERAELAALAAKSEEPAAKPATKGK